MTPYGEGARKKAPSWDLVLGPALTKEVSWTRGLYREA